MDFLGQPRCIGSERSSSAVVILTSSNEEQDRLERIPPRRKQLCSQPVDCNQFFEADRQLGLHWLVFK